MIYITNKTRKILELLALGVTIVIVGQSIKGSQANMKYFGKLTLKELNKLKHRIDKLQKAKLVHLSGEKVKLTAMGRKILKNYQIEKLTIPQKQFEGKWQVLSWDIPKSRDRDAQSFRLQLKNWGFTQMHASLWVFPWKCKPQIATLAKWYKLSDYIVYLEIDHLPKVVETKLKSKFNLK